MTKRLLAVLLALLIVVGCLPVAGATGAGSEFSDMPDNWSTVALKSAVANGLLIGDNGKIMPENPLTRAQMATIIVRAFGATEEGDISAYTDVKSTDWFASSIAKAYKMGVMEGYAGKMNPDNNITREQAFAVLARALKLEPASKCNKTFEDISNVSEWATGEVYAMVNAGYIQGANGKLNPQSNIRRNEFAQVMYNLMQQYIVQEGEYTEAAEGNVMVNVPGVTLKGLTVKGDLIIGDGVGDGNVILDDVVVTGRLVIRGGGKNSIIICGSSDVSNVIATRVDGAVRVKVEGNAKVETIYVDDGSDDIIIVGSVGSVEVAAGNVTVTATGANIGSANISGSGSALIVDSSSKVDSVSVTATNAEVNVEGSVNNITTSAANTSVTGKGSVNKVEVKQGADGAKIETPKTEITVSEGVSDVTAGGGTKVESGSTVTNNGNGTGVEEPSTGGGGGVVPATPVETIAANVDYAAVWNETRGTWYIKVSVPEESLDATSVTSINVIKEAGEELTEPRTLTPDTDKVLWFGVAKGDGNTSLKTAGEYAYEVVRKNGTKYIFNFTYAPGSVTGVTNLVQAALDAVNAYLTSENYNYSGAPEALEGHLATLGLRVGEGSDYAKLDKTATGGKNRKTAVFYDLNSNKGEGYDLDKLTTYFNGMVATRLATEESMDLVNKAENIEALNGISFVTMLLERFHEVSYLTHSDIPVTEKIDTLQDLVDRYNALGETGKTAVLGKIIEKRPENGYARSQATTDALADALTAVESEINARLTITSVSIADNKAYASTAADGGTVRVLGYGVGINLDAKTEGKKISDTTSIVVELYKGETLLGQQTLNETGRSKHGDKSVISGTIDAGGQYKATSWDNSWSVGIAVIPTKAVATVHYSDGTAIAEKALNFTEEQTKIFYAAEKVHALFENVFAESLALKEGVTQADINAAQTLVNEVTNNPTQNKAALGELIDKAWTLLGATKVTDESSLTAALGSEGSNIIVLGNDISLSSTASISKDVTIIGNGRTISGAFFNVQSGNVVFENVKFQGAGSSGSQDAIQVRSGASTTVKGCEFNGFCRGINAYFGSTISVQNNTFTDVYRCIIAGMGPAGAANVSVTDISGNTFNLGFERNNTGKYARGVSYNTDSEQGKDSLSAAVSHMLTNNTFNGDSNVDLDHQVRFYSGYQNYVNQPITDGTSDNVTVVNGTASEVIPSGDQRELVLGKITVTVSEAGMTATELSNKLTKAGFVESITVKDSSGNTKSDGTIADGDSVYVKSKDGKNTNYYIVKIESAGQTEQA